MQALHVIAGVGRAQGGPSYTAPALVGGLRRCTTAAELWSVRSDDDAPLPGVDAILFDPDRDPLSRRLAASRALEAALHKKAAGDNDLVVHAHGLWLAPNLYAGQAARRFRRPLIVSPRGMVAKAALAFSPLRKRLFWALAQKSAYAGAAFWHATSQAEADDIQAFGVTAPIAIIPNGVDLIETASKRIRKREILFLGRIHPKKGLVTLLEAWKEIQGAFPDWALRIIGPDEGRHGLELEKLAARLALQRVSVEPPLYGDAKTAALQSASLFVLPTLNENFGVAVAEALAVGTPAIVTRGAPWSGLETEKCGWWIDHGARALADAMRAAMSATAAERDEMGARGRAWVERDFGWDKIARDMRAIYEQAITMNAKLAA